MPQLLDSALELLHDIDFNSKKIEKKELDTLIKSFKEAKISERKPFPVKRLKTETAGKEIPSRLGELKLPKETEIPKFEIERIDSYPIQFERKQIFDLNQKFIKPNQTLGPFPVFGGPDIVFTLYKYINDFKIFYAGETKAALIIPIRTIRISFPGGNETDTLNLIKGSVWIRADLLDTKAPSDTYTGLKVKSGSLKLSKKYKISGDSLTIAKTTQIATDFELNNDFETDPSIKTGPDGKNTVFNPTDRLKLKSARGKITNLVLDGVHQADAKTMSWSSGFSSKATVFKWDSGDKTMKLEYKQTPRAGNFGAKSASDLYEIKGKAKILAAFWQLGTRVLQNNLSIEVEFNGVLILKIDEGLTAQWDGIRNPETDVRIGSCELILTNGLVYISTETADFGLLHDRVSLWQKSEDDEAHMEADISFSSYKKLIVFSAYDTGDAVYSQTDADLLIDKPIGADNHPIHPKLGNCVYMKASEAKGKTFALICYGVDSDGNLKTEGRYQFALENAYFTTSKEILLILKSEYDDSNTAYKGEINCFYVLYNMLPSLPHPYASNRIPQLRKGAGLVEGTFQSITEWDKINDYISAEVSFKMNRKPETGQEAVNHYSNVRNGFALTRQFPIVLFDVSTESDHWGVAYADAAGRKSIGIYKNDIEQTAENAITINKNYIQTPHSFLLGMTLPQVSWEPVFNITPPNPSTPDPQEGLLNQVNNHIPTVFYQADHTQTKIHPKDYIHKFKHNLRNEETENTVEFDSKILFTLPNGILSTVSLTPFNKNKNYYNDDHLRFIEPEFDRSGGKLKGGMQLRIAARNDNAPGDDSNPPKLRGITQQYYTLKQFPGISILGETVTEIFNGNFKNDDGTEIDKGVPVTHLDFSGYGASTFSNWTDPLVKFAAISQAKFDVLKGRTANELVQAVSVIYPWGISVTRTITFNRNNNAVIFREDSGWVAKTEGLFDFSFDWPVPNSVPDKFDSPFDIYPGVLEGLSNIRNILEDYNDVINTSYYTQTGDYYLDKNTNQILTNENGKFIEVRFVAVYFDADIKLDALDDRVMGKRFKGYLQVKPNGIPIPARVLKEVMEKSKTPILGQTDAMMPIEKGKQNFKVNAIEMNASYQNDNQYEPVFVGSVKGSFVFPKEGSWSVVEVNHDGGTVKNLDPGVSPGLIKDGMVPKNGSARIPLPPSAQKSLLAFPDALKSNINTFKKTFGIIQSTDTQKLMLKSVEYALQKPEQFLSDTALLADSFRLLNSKGPFPNIEDAIKLLETDPTKTVMKLMPEGIQKVFNYTVPSNFKFDIVGKEGDDFRIYLKYTSIDKDGNEVTDEKTVIDYVTDPSSIGDWANEMKNITIAVDLGIFKPILYVSGNFQGGKNAKAGLEGGTGPQLKLDEALQKIYDILEFLQNLDPKSAASEAVKKGLNIVMSNSADSWEYKFKADKEIPLVRFPFLDEAYNSPTCPLKMEAFFRLGVFFNQPLKIPESIDQLKPSVGAYLELGATLKVMCFSVAAATIYANGSAEVRLAADLVSGPSLRFKFGFGAELAVGFPVIGNASVTFMTGIDMELTMKDFTVGAFLYFRGRVEIFGGVATITISIEAKGQVQKKIGNGPTNCIATCTLAVDISIAWIINISFTETWSETRQIS